MWLLCGGPSWGCRWTSMVVLSVQYIVVPFVSNVCPFDTAVGVIGVVPWVVLAGARNLCVLLHVVVSVTKPLVYVPELLI